MEAGYEGPWRVVMAQNFDKDLVKTPESLLELLIRIAGFINIIPPGFKQDILWLKSLLTTCVNYANCEAIKSRSKIVAETIVGRDTNTASRLIISEAAEESRINSVMRQVLMLLRLLQQLTIFLHLFLLLVFFCGRFFLLMNYSFDKNESVNTFVWAHKLMRLAYG